MNLGCFGPESFRPGSFWPIFRVGSFSLGRWVVLAIFVGELIRPRVISAKVYSVSPRHFYYGAAPCPFSPVPCPFSESTFCALHFGKKFFKIGQKIRKLQDFLLEVCRKQIWQNLRSCFTVYCHFIAVANVDKSQ